ncbi:MAG: hypothetical protein R3D98_14960 [Candidatus Krumholzibacteriia bacterium]
MPRFALGASILILLALLAAPASAQLYDAGRLSFSYVQTPFPGYSGSFAADGPALPPDGQLPPGQTEAVGGGTAPATTDSLQTAIYAVTANANGTFDVALAASTAGAPTPGTYPVNLSTGTASSASSTTRWPSTCPTPSTRITSWTGS